MERHEIAPRENWQAAVEEQGLIWHGEPGEPYWDERAYYAFTMAEVEKIESASEAVFDLFVEAGDRIVDDPRLLARFGIPDYCHDPIRATWKAQTPTLDYGRFDFGYDGTGDPKLFEFNCDTPTSMLECAVVQWEWKETLFPDLDQFNSLHEKLIARWQQLRDRLPARRLWFTHADDPSHEDTITTTYMRDVAQQAGIETLGVLIEDIGIDAAGRVVDHDDQLITALFKLYPWEWIVREEFGRDIVRNMPETIWIEPIWKMIWSNKAILPILWELFPRHPNLLPAALDPALVGPNYAAKPILAREGANIEIVRDGETVARTGGAYQGEPMVYQALYPMRDFGQGYPVIGSWVVDSHAAGMGIREDGLITGNRARFVPHVIRG